MGWVLPNSWLHYLRAMHIDLQSHLLFSPEATLAMDDEDVLQTFTVPIGLRVRELQALEMVGLVRLAACTSHEALTLRAGIDRGDAAEITCTFAP
jgi:hypothetical protein